MKTNQITSKNDPRIPNLLVPGAAKSGTSSLHDYLGQHPSIFMSKEKEPHYFCQTDNGSNLDTYLSLFEDGVNYKYRGESSTGYMFFEGVIENIKKNISNPCFIFILRNPIDRAYSHYNWLRGFGVEKKGFFDALRHDFNDEPNFNNSCGPGYKYYFQSGLYGKWLCNYYNHFDYSKILIITTESLKSNFNETMNKCFSFLDLEGYTITDNSIRNKTIVIKNTTIYYYLKSYSFNNNRLFRYLYHNIFSDSTRGKISGYRSKIANTFSKLSRTKQPYQPLTIDQRKQLFSLYQSDIKMLKEITEKNFSEWDSY